MKQRPTGRTSSSEKIIRDIKRNTRKQTSAEENIRIVVDGVRGEASIAELCRREGIAQSLTYKGSKDFMEAGKQRNTIFAAQAFHNDTNFLLARMPPSCPATDLSDRLLSTVFLLLLAFTHRTPLSSYDEPQDSLIQSPSSVQLVLAPNS